MPSFEEARALLLRHREDPEAARRLFRWPDAPRFNWALEHFDRIAAGNDAPALRVLGPEGERALSFAALSRRSSQLANHLRGLGVRRGDRVLLLLGNVPALWEATLAAIKLGAVVIPAATVLGAEDLRDRITRGRARHVITEAALAPRLDGMADGLTRLVAEGEAPGWLPFEAAFDADPAFTPDGETASTDPLLLYFTSGTTARPKLVLHTHVSYPVGHLSTMYWLGVRPGDVHLNLASPGWAKHAWSSVFAPWNAGATIMALNQPRFDARALLDVLEQGGVTTFCAPPTVWRMLVQEDLGARRVTLREACAAGEPLNPEVIEQVRASWGLTVRDGYGQTETTLQVANTPGVAPLPGAMGRPLPGYDVRLLDPDGAEAEEGELCLPLDPPPLGLMAGYEGEDGTLRPVGDGRHYRTGDVARREAGRHAGVRRPRRRRVQVERLPHLPLRDRERAGGAPAGRGGRGGAGAGRHPRAAAQGLRGAGGGRGAGRGHGGGAVRAPAREPRTLQAGAPHRVLRAAQDHQRQDPTGGAARTGGGGGVPGGVGEAGRKKALLF